MVNTDPEYRWQIRSWGEWAKHLSIALPMLAISLVCVLLMLPIIAALDTWEAIATRRRTRP